MRVDERGVDGNLTELETRGRARAGALTSGEGGRTEARKAGGRHRYQGAWRVRRQRRAFARWLPALDGPLSRMSATERTPLQWMDHLSPAPAPLPERVPPFVVLPSPSRRRSRRARWLVQTRRVMASVPAEVGRSPALGLCAFVLGTATLFLPRGARYELAALVILAAALLLRWQRDMRAPPTNSLAAASRRARERRRDEPAFVRV